MVFVEGAEHLQAVEACHLCREPRNGFREEVKAVVGELDAVHLQVPGGGMSIVFNPTVEVDVDVILRGGEPEAWHVQSQVAAVEGRREEKWSLKVL